MPGARTLLRMDTPFRPFALALCLAPRVAWAQASDEAIATPAEEAVAPEQGTDVVDATPAPEATLDDAPRLHDYAIVLGLDGLRFRLQDGARMGMTGPSLGVSYLVGHRWGFAIRGVFTFPLLGREHLPGESSETYSLRSIYENQRGSYDVMVGFYHRRPLGDALDLTVAGGIHARLLGLTDSQFQPVQLVEGGFAGFARIDYPFAEHFTLGGEAYLGIDPLDFIDHFNRTVIAVPMSLSFFVGARR